MGGEINSRLQPPTEPKDHHHNGQAEQTNPYDVCLIDLGYPNNALFAVGNVDEADAFGSADGIVNVGGFGNGSSFGDGSVNHAVVVDLGNDDCLCGNHNAQYRILQPDCIQSRQRLPMRQ